MDMQYLKKELEDRFFIGIRFDFDGSLTIKTGDLKEGDVRETRIPNSGNGCFGVQYTIPPEGNAETISQVFFGDGGRYVHITSGNPRWLITIQLPKE